MTDKLTVRAYRYSTETEESCSVCESKINIREPVLVLVEIRDGQEKKACRKCVPVLRRLADVRYDRLITEIEEYNESNNRKTSEWCEAIDVIDDKGWVK